MKIAIISIALMCATVSCSYLNKKAGLPDDHPIEELAEFVIEQQTGLDIDLTP